MVYSSKNALVSKRIGEIVNLFDLGRANVCSLEAQLHEIEGDSTLADLLPKFMDLILSTGRLSMNLTSPKLGSMLDAGRHLNPYELAESEAQSSGRTAEEHFREHQGNYYPQRSAFDRHFEGGERFRYGALNAGGPGPSYCGRFCLILEQATDDPSTACVPGNSLERYVPPAGGPVDERRLEREIGPWSHRAHVAAIKHSGDVPATEPAA